jgi:hypothetical protein
VTSVYGFAPSKSALTVTLLTYIWDVIEYSDLRFPWYSSVPPGQFRDSTLVKLRSLPAISSVVHRSPLPSISSPVNVSLFSRRFNIMQSKIQTAPVSMQHANSLHSSALQGSEDETRTCLRTKLSRKNSDKGR